MKILFAGHNTLLGTFVETLAKKSKVVVLFSNRGKNPKWKNVNLKIVNYAAFGTRFFEKLFKLEISAPSYINGLGGILRREQPDVIVVFDFFRLYFWQFIWLLRKQSRVKLFLYAETKSLPKNVLARMILLFFIKLLRWNSERIEKVLVFTKEGEAFFDKYVPEIEVVLAPAPVDTSLFFCDSNKSFMSDGTLRVLMNARYVKYKNHQDLFKALSELRRSGKKFRLTLIGRGGNLQEELKNEIRKINLVEEVEFLNPVPRTELRELYIRHDVLILPSLNEAVGMVVPEAMACGIPTITSDTVGANVYVKNGETGIIYKTGNVPELSKAIYSMMDSQLLRRMGKCAYKHINDHYSKDSERITILQELGIK